MTGMVGRPMSRNRGSARSITSRPSLWPTTWRADGPVRMENYSREVKLGDFHLQMRKRIKERSKAGACAHYLHLWKVEDVQT